MDVLVAGGGPAGCTTAAAMAQLGLRTLIADAGQDRHKM
ncbi:MAG: FAD-binding protein, partial [Myxococcaceae bacterium]